MLSPLGARARTGLAVLCVLLVEAVAAEGPLSSLLAREVRAKAAPLSCKAARARRADLAL